VRYHVTVHGRTLVVDLGPDGLRVDGEPVTAELTPVGDRGVHALRVEGASRRVVARAEGGGRWRLHLDGTSAVAEVIDERTRVIREMVGASAAAHGPRPLTSPMPGLVVRVEVVEGERVVEGQGLVIVEAMKMENELRAQVPALVRRVLVRAGDTVDKDQVLLDLGPPDEAGP
jgi:pyruvate carboxylase subunit B